ncbi:MAG: hypothetical protein EPN23_08485 [Verrucomicrobia bacterium]|nr:MAG: hypothetical protein EPN23_08485 [Verrucomicrobiota bacterium]
MTKTISTTAILPGYVQGRPAASRYLGGIPTRTLAELMRKRKIPFSKLGHRTVIFKIADLDKAVAKFRVAAAGEEVKQ